MELLMLRHATLVLTLGELRFLVDPMLADQGSMDPIADTPNPRPNPLVALPFQPQQMQTLLDGVHAVLITHRHRDHWDDRAAEWLDRSLPIFCQPQDAEFILAQGFSMVYPVDVSVIWHDVQITRTGGKHGRGALAKRMGPVSGYFLRAVEEPSVYIAGDTVWCSEVSQLLRHERPEVVVVNAGAAQFLQGGPITMDLKDVQRVRRTSPAAHLVAVHMEAINHCVLSRSELKQGLRTTGDLGRTVIPADGDQLVLRSGHLQLA